MLLRFFGAVVLWEADFGGLMVVAAGEIVSGLAVAGASTGGVGIGAGLLCVDIFPDGKLERVVCLFVVFYLVKLDARIEPRAV